MIASADMDDTTFCAAAAAAAAGRRPAGGRERTGDGGAVLLSAVFDDAGGGDVGPPACMSRCTLIGGTCGCNCASLDDSRDGPVGVPGNEPCGVPASDDWLVSWLLRCVSAPRRSGVTWPSEKDAGARIGGGASPFQPLLSAAAARRSDDSLDMEVPSMAASSATSSSFSSSESWPTWARRRLRSSFQKRRSSSPFAQNSVNSPSMPW